MTDQPTDMPNRANVSGFMNAKVSNEHGLAVKLRRIVRTVLTSTPALRQGKPYAIQLTGVPQIMDSSKPVFVRFIWILVLWVCFLVCMFQVYNCIDKYLDEPVAVDVDIREQEKFLFPSITVANTESEGLYQLWNKTWPNSSIFSKYSSCLAPMSELLSGIVGLDTIDMWNLLNTSETLPQVDVKAAKRTYPVRMTDEFGAFGSQVKLELDEAIPYGGIYTKLAANLRKISGGCSSSQITGSIQPHGMPSDMRTTWIFSSLLALQMMLTMQKFEFVNRRVMPCIDKEQYFHCRAECAAEVFKNFSCRFPFLPKEVKLPTCKTGGDEAKRLYTKSISTYVRMNCPCARLCEHTIFKASALIGGREKNHSSIEAHFSNSLMITMRERFAYDVISLFSDIGGSLGLCLGFSILSIFQLLQGIIKSAKSKWNQLHSHTHHSLFSDPLLRRINWIVRGEIQRRQQNNVDFVSIEYPIAGLSDILNSQKRPAERIAWFVIIAICFFGYCFFVYTRVAFYLSDPTSRKVEIEKNDTVHFPTLTICGDHFKGVMLMRKLAKKRKHFRRMSSGLIMPDWCKYQVTDMLDIPGMDLQAAWAFMSVYEEHKRAYDVAQFDEMLKNITLRPAYMPEGICAQFSIGEQAFAGTTSAFTKLSISKADEMFGKEILECDRSYYTIYLKPPNGTKYQSTRLIYPRMSKTMLMMESKKVTLLNLPRRPCTDHYTANQCSIRCYEEMLRSRLICRLPFMPNFGNLTNCTDTSNGRAAYRAYMDTVHSFQPIRHKSCRCMPSCTTIILSTVVYTEPLYLAKMTMLGVLYVTNIQEHVVELSAYTVSKLLCDLGGNLGLALGLSLLSIFDMAEILISAFICHLYGKRTANI